MSIPLVFLVKQIVIYYTLGLYMRGFMSIKDCEKLYLSSTRGTEREVFEKMQSAGCPDDMLDTFAAARNIPTERNQWWKLLHDAQDDKVKLEKLIQYMQVKRAPVDILNQVIGTFNSVPDVIGKKS
jgi:hypothetical protein